jgi:type IX secretion system PorP/SprF family membrane protein
MMQSVRLFLVLFWLNLGMVAAQDFHYSQFYAAPLFLNPALTGSTELTRVGLNYRKQWPGLDHNFNSYSAYADHYSMDMRSGFGLALNSFQETNFRIVTSDVSLFYSYNLRLSETTNFRMGVQTSYVRRSAALDNLIFGDQVNLFTRTVNPVSIDQLAEVEPYGYADFSFGGLFTSEYVWLGTSVHHINQPRLTFFPSDGFARLPVKWSVHGGVTLPLGASGYFGSPFDNSVSLMANYKAQGPFKQFDIGAQFLYQTLIAGLGFRGIPGVRDLPNQDSIIFLLGMKLDTGIVIGYSYDFMVSAISTEAKGAHEISMRYQFMVGDPRKRNQRSRVLKCFDFMM